MKIFIKLVGVFLALALLASGLAMADDDILDFLPAIIKPAKKAPASFWCIDLGHLGGERAGANAINNNAVVVGWSTIAGSQRSHAFRWTYEEKMSDMGTLLGGSDSWACGIDDSGVVVGWSSSSASISRAVTWATGSPVDLGTLAGQLWNSAKANAINGGSIVGGCEIRNNPSGANPYHAVKWSAGSILDLDPQGTINSEALAVNHSGQVAGVLWLSSGATHPFFGPTAAGLQDLGTFGGANGGANGINNRGQVVGYAQNSGGKRRAFLWTPAGGKKDLGSLGEPDSESSACGINRYSWVVGASSSHAFLWTPQGGMVDLNDITFGEIEPGDYLSVANAVNDAGQIVGETAQGRAFALEPLY